MEFAGLAILTMGLTLLMLGTFDAVMAKLKPCRAKRTSNALDGFEALKKELDK